MTLCPVAIAIGCKKCALFKICPVKSVIGDYKPEVESSPSTARKAPPKAAVKAAPKVAPKAGPKAAPKAAPKAGAKVARKATTKKRT